MFCGPCGVPEFGREAFGCTAPACGPVARIVTVPSAGGRAPASWGARPPSRIPGSTPPVGSCARGARGSAGAGAGSGAGPPHATRRSRSPPKPVWRAESACQTDPAPERSAAGSAEPAGRPSSSSKKIGPVSSTGAVCCGAGRLVPGTQDAPFQYRT
ncbi:hypothetical protein [Streptomyces sp. NRRL S-623]|uniref:hypothetical protein n=1 Tax=Streptomyces sp. NRRL S-623 TaxID=1463916 RepID=UPI001F3C18EF|nr:hypothetical protein [Streptomyces sp. NRRL S-623]